MNRSLRLLSLLLFTGFISSCKRGVVSKGDGEAPRPFSAADASSAAGSGPRTRTALVIGNSRYKQLEQLDACKNDAETMGRTFQQIGIPLHGGKPLFDLTADQMDAAIASFARSLGQESEAFVYFTGHGAQIGGSNYLLPVNYDAQYENQAKRQAISLDSILETLERTQSRLRVVILDACRDPGNLLPGEPLAKSSIRSKGLDEQRVDAPETLVCFATKHGTVALADANASFYSRVLAEEMVKPARIDDVLRTVARRVYTDTEKRQLPFTYGSLLQDHFFVALPEPAPATGFVREAVPSTPSPPPRVADLEMAKLTTPVPPNRIPAPSSQPQARSPTGVTPKTATKESPFVNSLGMQFVPVPGTAVLFCVWETRVQDYEAFAKETQHAIEKPNFEQGPTYPAVNVSWDDAVAFCAWLSKKEGVTYRLPTDAEWSVAVGLGAETGNTPQEKDGKLTGYPWGAKYPPPKGTGNFDPSLKVDTFAKTSPAGSFNRNSIGLFDLSGNVWEWCDDWFDKSNTFRVLRGGSWFFDSEFNLRSAFRLYDLPTLRYDNFGFRCVLAVSGGKAPGPEHASIPGGHV